MNRDMAIQVGLLAVVGIATAVIGWLVWKDLQPEPVKTVENEEDESRAIIGYIGQHHPSEPEEYESVDDPICLLVHEITNTGKQNAAGA